MTTVIIGGSAAGLATALALSQQRRDNVLILERTAEAPGTLDEAHDWTRPTVPQGVHSHAFGSLGCNILKERAPEIWSALLDAGAKEIHLTDSTPPGFGPYAVRPGDEDLRMLTSRRSTFEWVLRDQVVRQPGVTLRSGVTVRDLVYDDPAAPARVTGVRLDDGSVVAADLVVDAAGRRSPVSRWLGQAGLPSPQSRGESCEITYYTRHFRLLADEPPGPLNRGFGAGGLWNHYTGVLFLGDNDTFSIALGVLPGDKDLKNVRNEEAFTAAIRATPLLAPWVAPGVSEPISEVYAMGGLDNMLRTLPEGADPVAGLVHVGDAVCTTNPAYGRGVSLALAHAYTIADVLAKHPEPDVEQARAAAEASEELLTPWFEDSVANDRARAGLWKGTVHGDGTTGTAPAGPPAGGPPAGGPPGGVAPAGGPPAGGPPAGVAPAGGPPAGGASAGGPPVGGASAGGPPVGVAPAGPPAGGRPAGGPPVGGPPAGGPPAGGASAGGHPAGGPPAGVAPAGGPPAGGPPAGGPPAGGPPAGGPPPLNFGMVVAASAADQTVWHHVARVMMTLDTPDTLYSSPEIAERVFKVLASGPPPQLPGAERADLVQAVGEAA